MNIRPSNTPAPKYPALATLAVAAVLSLPACDEQPQPTAGAPLPPPQRLGGKVPRHHVKPAPQQGGRATAPETATHPQRPEGQLVPGRAKIGD